MLGNSIGFLWGGGIVTRIIAKTVVAAPEKPRNPRSEMAEGLVNEGRYDQAAKLLQGCVTDECVVAPRRNTEALKEISGLFFVSAGCRSAALTAEADGAVLGHVGAGRVVAVTVDAAPAARAGP